MDEPLKRIRKIFGVEDLPHALFYHFDNSLRFELGGENYGTDRPIRRFNQAFHRAETIARKVFQNSTEISVLVSSYSEKSPDKKRLKPFRSCGLKNQDFTYLGKTLQKDSDCNAEFESDLYRHWDATIIADNNRIPELLWLAVASEIGVKPASSSGIYLVDFSNELVLHVYDDRGMDVVATERATVSAAYKEFFDWLSEHDLERMKRTFT